MNDLVTKKRILFYYMLGRTAGGSDTCLFLLLKNIDQSRFEPHLLYRDNSPLLEELKGIGIKTIPIPNKIRARLHRQLVKNADAINQPNKNTSLLNSLLKKFGNFGSLLSSLKDVIKKLPETFKYAIIIIKNKIDIVHTNHYLTGDRPMLLAAIILRKKVISHNRGLYGPDLIDRFLSKYIDQIISMSDFSTSVYVKGGVEEAKCKTIYDGIDVLKYNPSNIKSEKITVGCIGRIEKWKGQQVLVEAAEIIVKTISNIKFLLVGDGDNENELKNQIKSKGLEKYFEFTGHVKNVMDYMNQSTIIVHTSIEPEPFGMVIIEAMALEKPVIATSIGGPLEIIDNELDGLLIPPQNPSILAENIIRLIKDNHFRMQIGKKAREKVISKFNVRDYAKQIEMVYAKIAS